MSKDDLDQLERDLDLMQDAGAKVLPVPLATMRAIIAALRAGERAMTAAMPRAKKE